MREAGAWWLLLIGVWLLTLGAVTTSELAAAVLLALPCALAARAARLALGGRWRVRPGWVKWVRHLPVSALRDTFAVLRARGPGRLDRMAVAPDNDPAVATVAIGLTPGTLVADAGEDEVLVHSLVSRRSPILDEVTR